MIIISANLTQRIKSERSYLSFKSPAGAANTKNGKIKIPAAMLTKILGSMPAASPNL